MTDLKRLCFLVSLSCCCLQVAVFAAKPDVDKAVILKYSNVNSGSTDQWGALNCHDPKLFQDDDGTFYVYSIDASIGGAGDKGVQIRTSKDLVNWTYLAKGAIQKKWDRTWLKWVNLNMATASTWAPTVI